MAVSNALRSAISLPEWKTHVVRQKARSVSANSPWGILADFPITPLSRLGDDIIEAPESWVAAGSGRTPWKRTLRVLDFLPDGMTRQQCAYHEETVRRIIFALLMEPRKTGSGNRMLAPSTWLSRCRTLLKAARWSLENRFNPNSLFAHLSVGDVADLVVAMGTGVRAIGDLNRDLAYYGTSGLLHDVPKLDNVVQPASDGEASSKGESRRGLPKASPTEQTQPFGDDFVTEFIPRCLFISAQLGPPLLRAYQLLLHTDDWGVTSQSAVLKRRLNLLQEVDWSLGDGSVVQQLPFGITLRSEGGKRARVAYWPPKYWTEVRGLITFLQCANFNIIGFCIGARWSEHAAAPINCLTDDYEPMFKSRTFKLVNMVGGKERRWPLAEHAYNAIRMQQQLAEIASGENSGNLWVTFNEWTHRKRGDAPFGMNENNERFVRALGLEHLLHGIRPHTHRWRTTIARLAAMALFDAPRVLTQLFGHRNIEMTLRYILSNSDIRQEIEEAYEASAYALSEHIIEDADTFEGRGASRLRSLLEATMPQTPQAHESTLTDLVAVTGGIGRNVSPGVICIRQDGQYAPCSKGRGAPDPARCKGYCEHQLQDPTAGDDVNNTILFLLRELESEDVRDRPLVRAALEAQLLTQLDRFSDLRDTWLTQSILAKRIWDNASSTETSA